MGILLRRLSLETLAPEWLSWPVVTAHPCISLSNWGNPIPCIPMQPNTCGQDGKLLMRHIFFLLLLLHLKCTAHAASCNDQHYLAETVHRPGTFLQSSQLLGDSIHHLESLIGPEAKRRYKEVSIGKSDHYMASLVDWSQDKLMQHMYSTSAPMLGQI
jgi:hypothetical protein